MKARGKIRIRLSLLLALAAAVLLSGTAAGDFQADFASESLDTVIARYMDANGLTEDNFAMGWYDFRSGREWFFNADAFMVAGSMYKLPLNMYYTDRLAAGGISADDIVGEYTVERAMELSIVYSDNHAADVLEDALRLTSRDFQLLLSQYSGLDETQLPESYFTDNRVSARFMINTLVWLYDNSELYCTLIEHMKSAHPGRYFKKSEGEYEIAHKYGYFQGELNDCGIVYTPRPFALAAFTRKVRNSEAILSELCALMTEYSLYLDSLPELEYTPAPKPETEPRCEPAPISEHAPEPEPAPEPPAGPAVPGAAGGVKHVLAGAGSRWIYIAVCALLLGAAALRRAAACRRRRQRRDNEG